MAAESDSTTAASPAAPHSATSGRGALNRVIRLRASPNEVRAAIEDDFHHFRVRLSHDGRMVTSVSTETLRAPYTLCAAAGEQLQLLVGTPLISDPTAISRITDAREQCTHQFDIGALAVAMAARGEGARRYRATVSDPERGMVMASLDRDGERVLDWILKDNVIVSPGAFAGRSGGSGFTAFVANELQGDEAEAALVLRRAVFVAGGRRSYEWFHSISHAPLTRGCWVQQPARNEQARRAPGTTQDFTGRPEVLTAEDESWLAGE